MIDKRAREVVNTSPDKKLRSLPEEILSELQKLPETYDTDFSEEALEAAYPHLAKLLKNHQQWGADCHSYAFRAMGPLGLKHPIFADPATLSVTSFPNEIDRNDYELSTEFQDAVQTEYVARIKKDGANLLKFWRAFTSNFFEQSKQDGHDRISSLEPLAPGEMPTWSEEELQTKERSDKQLLASLKDILQTEARFPRMLTVTIDYPNGRIRDVHTSIVLGPKGDPTEDYWTLERTEIGSPVKLVPLSAIIERYNTFNGPWGWNAPPGSTLHVSLVKDEQTVLDKIPT